MITPIKIKSNLCLTPGNCYKIESEVPIWILAILTGASVFLLKEIYNQFRN